jgi:dTDP-4-dehydrorhamnose reductase
MEAFVNPLLIVGIDSIVGANTAAYFAEKREIIGVANSPGFSFPLAQKSQDQKSGINCHCHDMPTKMSEINEFLTKYRPTQVMFCGTAAQSAWFSADVEEHHESEIDIVRNWAIATQKLKIQLTLISSDAIFTGPWMFHEEDSVGWCSGKSAVIARAIESEAMAWNPQTLVARTNAYGWSPQPLSNTWVETLLQNELPKVFAQLDSLRHATPILATDLAAILEQAWKQNLSGIYHIAGAERCHPIHMARLVCEVFQLSWARPFSSQDAASNRMASRFGFGETSLQTKKIRTALNTPMPMLLQGIETMHAQYQKGFHHLIQPTNTPHPRELVKAA